MEKYYRHFALPESIDQLLQAQASLRETYHLSRLKFTFDGNLVGDLGEALAMELFGIRLVRGKTGIDGRTIDNRTVQIKASAAGRGPAFRPTEQRADHFIFFSLNLPSRRGVVLFNGPEHIALAQLPPTWKEQRTIPLKMLAAADAMVPPETRLPMITGSTADFSDSK